jgi:hypothetical protein
MKGRRRDGMKGGGGKGRKGGREGEKGGGGKDKGMNVE